MGAVAERVGRFGLWGGGVGVDFGLEIGRWRVGGVGSSSTQCGGVSELSHWCIGKQAIQSNVGCQGGVRFSSH